MTQKRAERRCAVVPREGPRRGTWGGLSIKNHRTDSTPSFRRNPESTSAERPAERVCLPGSALALTSRGVADSLGSPTWTPAFAGETNKGTAQPPRIPRVPRDDREPRPAVVPREGPRRGTWGGVHPPCHGWQAYETDCRCHLSQALFNAACTLSYCSPRRTTSSTSWRSDADCRSRSSFANRDSRSATACSWSGSGGG